MFGKLKVIRSVGYDTTPSGARVPKVECECECGNKWDVTDPRGEICLKCGRAVLQAKRKAGTVTMKTTIDFKETKEEDKEETLSYECL